MRHRSTTGIVVLLIFLSVVVGFVTVEIIQRGRYADTDRDLKAAIPAFESSALLTMDADGLLIRPVAGAEPVLGRFTHLIGTWEGYSRVSTWYLSAAVRSPQDGATADHDIRFEVELRQHRHIFLGRPQVLVDWPLAPSRRALLPLLESALRQHGIRYSLVDRRF